MNADAADYKRRLARAHAELQALADEHVDDAAGMGQDIPLSDLNVLRDAAQDLWDDEPLLSKDLATTLGGLSAADTVRTVFGIGVMVGWRAGERASGDEA